MSRGSPPRLGFCADYLLRKPQQQREQELVRSAKTKREKRIVRDRLAGRLPPPEP
jgi:hypothetical protein